MTTHVLGPDFVNQFNLEGLEGNEVVIETDMAGRFSVYVNGSFMSRTYTTDVASLGPTIQSALDEANQIKQMADSLAQFVVEVKEPPVEDKLIESGGTDDASGETV